MNSTEEINLHQIFLLFTKRWKFLLLLGLLFSLCALAKHKFFPTYPGVGKLIIKDVRNSQLQSFIGHVTLGNADLNSAELKGDDLVTQALAYLDNHSFYLRIATDLQRKLRKNQSDQLITFFNDYPQSKNNDEILHEVADKISHLITLSSAKGDLLIIEAKTNNRLLTVMLVNSALNEARNVLIERDNRELIEAENFFNKEISAILGRIGLIEVDTFDKLQKNQMTSSSIHKEDLAKYLGELKTNMNEVQMNIANNLQKIALIQESHSNILDTNDGNLSKFSSVARIRDLEFRNTELGILLRTYKNSLNKYEKIEGSQLPLQYELEKMNSNHERESKLYFQLMENLSRVGLQKNYVLNRVEILDTERFSKVHSSPGLLIMVLMAMALSQVVGLFSIYLFELFKPAVLNFS